MAPARVFLSIFIMSAVQLIAVNARSDASGSGCRWSESSGEWLLTRHLPAGDVSGSLGHVVVPFLHQHGIPVSFISRPIEDVDVQLHVDDEATVRRLLEEIVRQEPGYRYAVIEGKIVIFPTGGEYDQPFEATRVSASRARAMYSLLTDLKARGKGFETLQMPTLRGAGGQTIYGDRVDIEGTHTIIEHLASLTAPRPSLAFRILAAGDGRLAFMLDWVRLVEKIEVQGPSTMEVGAVIEPKVVGTLTDGTVVPLDGPCGVKYEVTEGSSLEIDDSGRVMARRTGSSTIRVRYENNFAQTNVVVK